MNISFDGDTCTIVLSSVEEQAAVQNALYVYQEIASAFNYNKKLTNDERDEEEIIFDIQNALFERAEGLSEDPIE